MLVQYEMDLCITDGSEDSHVEGRAWLPLIPLSGPTVHFANVVGFDKQSAKKCGLPIISGVVKVVNTNGRTIFMRANI